MQTIKIIEKEETKIVTGGTAQTDLNLDIPENILLKMRNLLEKFSKNVGDIDMREPTMGCDDCSGCTGCDGRS